jgi:hypothetical protein
MKVRDAAVRAVRTGLWSAAGLLLAVKVTGFADLALLGGAYLDAAVVGAHAAVVSFVVNFSEDNTDVNTPK